MKIKSKNQLLTATAPAESNFDASEMKPEFNWNRFFIKFGGIIFLITFFAPFIIWPVLLVFFPYNQKEIDSVNMVDLVICLCSSTIWLCAKLVE